MMSRERGEETAEELKHNEYSFLKMLMANNHFQESFIFNNIHLNICIIRSISMWFTLCTYDPLISL